MFKAALRGLLAHKLRLALTALAIVLGVGFISGTYVLTDTMNAAFDELFASATAGVDVVVRDDSHFEAEFGGSREPIDASLVKAIAAVDGVEIASGSVSGYAQFVGKDGEAITPGGAPTLGFNWTPEPLNPMEIVAGEPPQQPDEVVMDAPTADKHGFDIGDEVTVITLEGPRRFVISGTAAFATGSSLGGATIALFETTTAQKLFDKQDRFDSIDVAGAPGISETELSARVQQVLPEGVVADSAAEVSDEMSEAIRQGLGFFNTALLIFAGVALFVGSFLIFNTFSITVTQRTREFALLRALGASGRQVTVSVMAEAALMGLVAALAGLGAGVLIALGLNALLEAFGIDLPQTALQLKPRTVTVSLAVGVLVTLASSLAPARRAARISPMEALRESAPAFYRPSRRRLLGGTALVALGASALLFGLFGESSQELTYVGLGAAVSFIGVAVLAPAFARPIATALGAPLRQTFGFPAHLARQNVDRNTRRTAATAAALMVGLALVGLIAILADSFKTSIADALERSMRADFLIQSSSFTTPVISPRLAQSLAELDELAAVAPLRFGQVRHAGDSHFIVATDPQALEQTADIGVVAGDLDDLGRSGIFLYEPTARSLGLGVGDRFDLTFAATGKRALEIIGLFDDKTLVGSDYLVSLSTYDRNFPDRVDSNILIKAAEGVPLERARAAIAAIADDYPNVEVENQAEARQTYASRIDQLLGLVTALLALSLIIALLGITNTLALSVHERTREIGLLRAVGMERRQVRAMICHEAVIIAALGAALGLAIGWIFARAFVVALEPEGITAFTVPGAQLLTYLAAAVLAGMLAALPPARRAARLDVLRAIAEE